jgi:DHA1 family bicyclomycin/chloramphenicol resistance-like MFS transporter
MKGFCFRAKAWPLAPISLIILGASLWPEMELLVPSLPAMKAHFGVSEGEIQKLLSMNFFGFLTGILIVGPLCDSLGRKAVCLFGGIFFLLSSLMAPLCDDFMWLTVARFLQGLTVTAPIIAGSALLLELSGKRIFFWMSISSAVITMCMAGAPLVGSYINATFGFKGNLWAIFISATLGLLPVLFWVPESLPKERRIALKTKVVAKSYWQIFRNRSFLGMSFVVASLPAAYWVYTGVSSLYLVDYLKLDAALYGSYQGPIVGTFAVLSLGISWINKKIGMTKCLLAGFSIMAIGCGVLLALALLEVESAILTTIFMMLFVGGMVPANSLLFPSALKNLPQELQGSGQSVLQALRLLVASAGTFTLSSVYHGPFLPVALLLVGIFIMAAMLLWRMRHLIISDPEHVSMGH